MRTFFRFVFLALVLLVVALVSALTAMRFAIHGQEIRVPDLVGKQPSEARRMVDGAGLQFVIERQYYSPAVPEGRVLSQLPPPGTKVRRGWEVRVAQSLGPQRVQIPNLLGETERAAEINLRRRGLEPGALAVTEIPGEPSDQVVAQSPPANASQVATPRIGLLATQAPQPAAYVMPNFVGQTFGIARSALQQVDIKVGNVASAPKAGSPGSPQAAQPLSTGVIISQNPPAGSKIVAATTVTFEVR